MQHIPTVVARSPAVVTNPAGESFFNQALAEVTWPAHITTDPAFKVQCQNQQSILLAIQTVFAALPLNSSIADGIASGTVSEAVAGELYHLLASYLDAETANQRLILYLPFALTAPVVLKSTKADLAFQHFQDSYRTAWLTLLDVQDVRANFVDGNVLEQELLTQDHPRVVKAMHLLPGLIASGHITFSEALTIVTDSDNMLLKDCFLAACAVTRDLNLITDTQLQELSTSPDQYLRNGAKKLGAVSTKVVVAVTSGTFADICTRLRTAIAKSVHYTPQNSTPGRTAWLRKTARLQAIAVAAEEIAAILNTATALPQMDDLSVAEQLASIAAIRKASLIDSTIYTQQRSWLNESVHTTNQEVVDARTKLYAHLHAAGIVEDCELSELKIQIPALQGPFSKNLTHFAPSVAELAAMAQCIEQDAYLRKYIYPVVLAFGSQLKGYGVSDADADVAVFVRPDVSKHEQEKLSRLLAEVFSHKRIGGSVLLFWLEYEDAQLTIRENTQTTPAPALPTWTHILMGSAWIGESSMVQHLRCTLLAQYCYDPDVMIDRKPARERWLEELERDAILYRLLHKGYERFYPIKSSMDTVHGGVIDGASAFYDSRFRRIATELFLTKVFLPNLGRQPR